MLGVLLVHTACVTTDELAPPVDAIIGGRQGGAGAHLLSAEERASISLGRSLYLTDCADCHAPESVLAHTMHAWNEILPRMAKESKLTDDEIDAVREYVRAVHNWASVAAQ